VQRIKLTQDQFALIDDENLELINKYKWFTQKIDNRYYVATHIKINNKSTMLYMHRLIMGLKPGDKIEVDHIDHNGLNNRKENLRKVGRKQNAMNSRKKKNCSSAYKGVCFYKRDNLWVAYIMIDYKLIHLGRFINEIDAAKAYDNAAIKYFGANAFINLKIYSNETI
jgi:hypothetical protein